MGELNNHATFVLALIIIALGLFALERIRLQASALLVLIVLTIGFSIWPYTTVDGDVLQASSLLSVFGNQALIAVSALMVLGKGIETTRALQPLEGIVGRYWSLHPRLTMLFVLIAAAVMSAFMNNTPIVVILLPVLISIAQKNQSSPSKLLLPLGLATIIGGMATTIGTSTNLLVVDLADNIAGVQLTMFSITPYVVVAGSIGLAYLWLVAPAITPTRTSDEGSTETKDQREYIATLVVEEGSKLAEQGTVADLLTRTDHKLIVDRIQHNATTFRVPLPSIQLHAGDHIFVRGSREVLKEAELELGTSLRTVEAAAADDPELNPQLMEILVTERSELDGRSLRRSKLIEDFGIVAVALHRPEGAGERSKLRLNRIRLRARDILLCEGTEEQFERLLSQTRLLALTDTAELHFSKRASISLLITAAVILSAATNILPISVAAIAGIGLMRATKCLAWRHIGQGLSTQVILVIVVSLALGQALMQTGGDVYLAGQLASVLEGQTAAFTIPALMLIMALVTNVVSNNAAAVIGTPIGIQLAAQLNLPVEPMVLAVLFGANLSFATPIGYQTNLLVFSAGGYKFSDFIRVGLPLTLIMWAALSYLLVASYT